VTWPDPELDVGAEAGELRRPDELPDVPEPDDERFEVPEPEAAWRVPPDAEPADVAAAEAVAPGSVNATPPAAMRLAPAAETVTARSRARPRSRAAAAAKVLCLR